MSSDINEDVNEFFPWLRERRGAKWTECNKEWIERWLPRWHMFLRARTGKPLVTLLNLCLTIMGFVLYIVDQGSDIGTSIYYACRQWWRAIVTLTIVYGTVIMHTVLKLISGLIHCTGSADWLRYVVSLLINWPDVKQYGALCLLEWNMCKFPAKSARLIPEWHERSVNVAILKVTEGVCEACPQAILQLCLLVPDLYGDWTWTEYLRITAASVSLCTAASALVNMEKFSRISGNIDLPLSELVVLHVWTIPVTVSRLLSVTLLLSVHPYWALAGVTLHLVLHGLYCCRTKRVRRALADVINICLNALLFLISPFDVAGSINYRRVSHAIHFLVNTALTVLWALGTPMMCLHPALHTAIIYFNAVLFVVGLLGWQLHEMYWRR